MKILHVSTSSTGGAARAAFRMNDALRAFKQDSNIMFLDDKPSATKAGEYPISRGLIKRLASSSLTAFQGGLIQSGRDPVTAISLNAIGINKILETEPDVVHIHNFYNLVSYPSIIDLTRKVKVFVTLHDQRFFTAGCHYSHSCLGYRNGCNSCPQMNPLFQSGASRKYVKNMRNLSVDSRSLTLISPSEWLLSKARENSVFSTTPGFVLRNPIPEFDYLPKVQSDNKPLQIGFCSDKLDNPLKGLEVLTKALVTLNRDYVLKLVGRNIGNFKIPEGVTFEIHSPRSDTELASELREMDVLVVPSIQDNSPNVIGEALMCGTKVIGSDIGGIGELMRQLQMDTFQPDNISELKNLLADFDPVYSKSNVVNLAREVFSYGVVAPKMVEIYHG
jgi:glycosyltransferase involved in cell wall biosynthesis